jgi:hypothetical protein
MRRSCSIIFFSNRRTVLVYLQANNTYFAATFHRRSRRKRKKTCCRSFLLRWKNYETNEWVCVGSVVAWCSHRRSLRPIHPSIDISSYVLLSSGFDFIPTLTKFILLLIFFFSTYLQQKQTDILWNTRTYTIRQVFHYNNNNNISNSNNNNNRKRRQLYKEAERPVDRLFSVESKKGWTAKQFAWFYFSHNNNNTNNTFSFK